MAEVVKDLIESDFLSSADLAAKLAISRRTVEKWEAARQIPGRVKVGRLIRYRKTDVEKALLSGALLLPKRA